MRGRREKINQRTRREKKQRTRREKKNQRTRREKGQAFFACVIDWIMLPWSVSDVF